MRTFNNECTYSFSIGRLKFSSGSILLLNIKSVVQKFSYIVNRLTLKIHYYYPQKKKRLRINL